MTEIESIERQRDQMLRVIEFIRLEFGKDAQFVLCYQGGSRSFDPAEGMGVAQAGFDPKFTKEFLQTALARIGDSDPDMDLSS
jgi:hypothetical protein